MRDDPGFSKTYKSFVTKDATPLDIAKKAYIQGLKDGQALIADRVETEVAWLRQQLRQCQECCSTSNT